MKQVFLIVMVVYDSPEGELIHFLALAPHYIMMLAIKRKAGGTHKNQANPALLMATGLFTDDLEASLISTSQLGTSSFLP